MTPVGLAVAERVVEVDLAVVGARRPAQDQGVDGAGRVRRPSRTCPPGSSCRARRPPGRPRSANGPSSDSAAPLRSEPGSPKSRANASGKTTRSLPSGVSSASRSRFSAGSRVDASCTKVTCMAPVCPRCQTGRRPVVFDAVVLAGGRATRLGGADKAAPRGRRPDPPRPRTRRRRRRRTGSSSSATTAPTASDVTWVRERPPYGGPVAATYAGVDALRPGTRTWLVVMAVDMPDVDRRSRPAVDDAGDGGRRRSRR